MNHTLFSFRLALPALGALLAVAPLCSAAPAEADLLAARETVWRAWFAHDVAAFDGIVPADLIAMGAAEGQWTGRDATLEASARFVAQGGKLLSLSFPRTEAQRFGDVVVLYSTYEAELEQGGARSTLAGRATEVFVKRNGRWEHPGWHLDPPRQ
jgi:ketosteroid isomerase-like protein